MAKKADRIRALQILDGSPQGATSAALGMHGFTAEFLNELVEAGLVSGTIERVSHMEIVRLRITAAGKAILARK